MSWDDVREALPEIKAISFDGCHKIYALLNEGAVEDQRDIGYGDGSDDSTLVLTEGMTPDAVIAQLEEYFEASCGLRFISGIRAHEDGTVDNASFVRLIEQFELDVCESHLEDTDDDGFCMYCGEQ